MIPQNRIFSKYKESEGSAIVLRTVRPKSINAVSRANFDIVKGVHPSTLQIKKKQDRPRPFLGPIEAWKLGLFHKGNL